MAYQKLDEDINKLILSGNEIKFNVPFESMILDLTSISFVFLSVELDCYGYLFIYDIIVRIDQLTEDTFSFRPKDLIFVKSSKDNRSITDSNKPRLSKVEDSTLSNHDTVCSTPLPPLKKLDGAEPVSGPKTIKSILKSKSTFKAETLKGIIINEPSSTPAGKLKNVKMEDDPPLAIVMKELNDLKLQISKNKSSYSKNKNTQQESNLETLNMSQRTVKHVVAMFIPHLITMTLSGLRKGKFFKLRKLSLSKQTDHHQFETDDHCDQFDHLDHFGEIPPLLKRIRIVSCAEVSFI
nr:hypothetical protein [Tanacetum cinerariifolium]